KLITKKLDGLKGLEGLNKEIEAAKKCSAAFTNKLKSSHGELGIAQGAVTDENAKKAILKTDNTKDKGAAELEKLSKSVKS
ncbi:Vsp/OspC family lipoprotein, partial [Borreliella valaisiana]|uniref:Vsp/OspC family lipoprotein n=1 Tax=Borreliella valaisiana TaxID=62088 RepID=UPI002350EC21